MENTKIEWAHHTGNLWKGCTEVHSGCDHCYARTFSNRWPQTQGLWDKDKQSPRLEVVSVWSNFKKWQKQAEKENTVHKVFVGSMMDIFEISHPVRTITGEIIENVSTGDLRDRFFNEVVPNCPNLLFLLLTKRPSNIMKMIPESWQTDTPLNVIFGTSVSEQSHVNTLIKQLVKVPGWRFISMEPQLEKVVMDYGTLQDIHWVIQGGESGHGKRPFDTTWAKTTKYECALFGVPYFFKQIDKVQEIPEDLLVREEPLAYHTLLKLRQNGK